MGSGCSAESVGQHLKDAEPSDIEQALATMDVDTRQRIQACLASGQTEQAAAIIAEKEKAKQAERTHLLDYYEVGDMLGQGAFGIVYACNPIEDQTKDCAVKMIDKVEAPIETIKKEAEMLQTMTHRNVIKCHDIIYEKCFVCIVMDRLRGGDLIVGMQAHWQSKGKIPVAVIMPICAQMAASTHYLHQRKIVHRDIKGDNYLTDRADITDKECRIVLTDFGTATPCEATQRLDERCGTLLYWSPEFYKMDYSLKVDIWAMGVLVYGLLHAKFPFRGEGEVMRKKINVPKGTPKPCADFLQSLLEKDENKRANSQEVAEAEWIREAVAAGAEEEEAEDFNLEEGGFQEGGAAWGAKLRRHELVERMREGAEHKAAEKSKAEQKHYWRQWFSIVHASPLNVTLIYEWWAADKVDKSGLLNIEGARGGVAEAAINSSEMITLQLKTNGVDTTQWGQGSARSLPEFVEEIQTGEAVLMLDAACHKKLVRVVDVVLLRICAPGSKNKFMIETGEKFPDGRERSTNRLPGTKKQPHENSKQVAERVVAEMLDLGGATVVWDLNKKEIFEEQEDSRSFPGLSTVYRKQILEGQLQADGTEKDAGDWYRVEEKTKNTKYFAWKTAEECDKCDIDYKPPEAGDDDISGLVQAPIGMDVAELSSYFERHNVDISSFGKGTAKSLADISSELMKGESCLMVEVDGTITRIVDVVVVKLVHALTQSILVQTQQETKSGTKTVLDRLPGTKRRPDENQFATARRILTRKLKIEENHVDIDANNVQVAEELKESLAYPGLRTVYRKRIITASLAREGTTGSPAAGA